MFSSRLADLGAADSLHALGMLVNDGPGGVICFDSVLIAVGLVVVQPEPEQGA